jgi:hypothetical protein
MRTSLAAAVALAAMTTSARADEIDDALERVGDALGHAVDRTRRDVVLGPHAGAVVGATVDEGELVHGVSFGLALYMFDSPSLADVVKARVKARLKAVVRDAVTKGEPPPDLAALAQQIAAEVIAELRGRGVSKGLLDRPRFGVGVEGVVGTSDGGGFQLRLLASKGVGKLSLGLMVGATFAGGEVEALGGVEASLRLTPVGSRRTPVVEPFVRVDAALQSELPFTVAGGLRLVADVF